MGCGKLLGGRSPPSRRQERDVRIGVLGKDQGLGVREQAQGSGSGVRVRAKALRRDTPAPPDSRGRLSPHELEGATGFSITP